ncbi:MAG: acyltransferase family protein [Deltaproteobacteria bacterium]|nr:acyltransferase family protein [Deltaproteobacteria bacterium]
MNDAVASRLARDFWLACWRAMIRYHRYEAEGVENLDGIGSALIAGYHGRPAAWDMAMLTVVLYDRLGYIPHGIFHKALMKPPVGWLLEGIGGVGGDSDELAAAVENGEHIIVTPGGVPEGTRSSLDKYRVHWGDRVGYVRLAARHRIPIVPAGAEGVDDTFIGLNNGYLTSRRFGFSGSFPMWVGIGPLGLSPFSPPFPVKIRTLIGKPIMDTTDPGLDPSDNDSLKRIHQKTTRAVQALLDRANGNRDQGDGK